MRPKMALGMVLAITLASAPLSLVPAPAAAADRVTGRAFATRSEVIAPHAMACTSQPLATQAALQVLRAGGNAVDAAIAANAVLGLTEPTGSGIGGDLFAIVWDAGTRKLYGLNGSGRSPRALTRQMLLDMGLQRIPPRGPLPVTVPGAVDGWFTLHERFGRLPMEQVLAPAIAYARDGFPVSQLIAYYWRLSVPLLSDQPGFLETFTRDGQGPQEGQLWRNPDLADTYERLARGGRDAFYEGDVARTIARCVQDAGGYLSVEDLAAHRSEWVEPVSTTYRDWEVWELPPNGQGIAALQILNLVEQFDVAAMGLGSADWVHLFVEAKKLAFEDRARWYADPAFSPAPVQALISKDYARRRAALIDMGRAARRVEAGEPTLEDGDTIYLTVADEDRNMVSLIQSNYRGMGSGLCPPGLGFGLQDRGELFDLTDPDHPNAYAPGKRPFHTIIPAFVTVDGKPLLSFGVMGGATQPQMHVQIVVNMVDFGLGLQEAGDAPRILHRGSSQPTGERMTDGGRVLLESGFGWETVRDLMERGHDVAWDLGSYGGYQAILYDAEQDVYRGASESRKDGQAAGY